MGIRWASRLGLTETALGFLSSLERLELPDSVSPNCVGQTRGAEGTGRFVPRPGHPAVEGRAMLPAHSSDYFCCLSLDSLHKRLSHLPLAAPFPRQDIKEPTTPP